MLKVINQEYKVTLCESSLFLLAKDAEHAAWSALELAEERGQQLVNVQLTDEW